MRDPYSEDANIYAVLIWLFTSQSTYFQSVPPVRLEPATPRPGVKHSTTELLRSPLRRDDVFTSKI